MGSHRRFILSQTAHQPLDFCRHLSPIFPPTPFLITNTRSCNHFFFPPPSRQIDQGILKCNLAASITTHNSFPVQFSNFVIIMAGGKGKSSGGKSSGGKTSAGEGPKKQQSHSQRAGLQVRDTALCHIIKHRALMPSNNPTVEFSNVSVPTNLMRRVLSHTHTTLKRASLRHCVTRTAAPTNAKSCSTTLRASNPRLVQSQPTNSHLDGYIFDGFRPSTRFAPWSRGLESKILPRHLSHPPARHTVTDCIVF